MSESRLTEDVLGRLRATLAAGPPLRLALLFGSAAAGRLRAGSDVDVAILPSAGDLPLHVELALQASLAQACGREVDLVRLDRAPTLVRWEVARVGQVLLASGPGEAASFLTRAAWEWLDFEPAFRRAGEAFRRRLAAGAKE